MKVITFLIIALFAYRTLSAEVPIEVKEQLNKAQSGVTTALGYDFMLAIPPNDYYNSDPYGKIRIFISSAKPTTVTLMMGIDNKRVIENKIFKPFDIITFTNAFFSFSNEVRIPEIPLDIGIRIVSSDSPISVYVMNEKQGSSEGFMALPVSAWGMDYIHIGYYDDNTGYDNKSKLSYFAGGFIVVAAEDDTKVEICLKGKGSEFSGTTSGKKIGDTIKVKLYKGQVYQVQGEGATAGVFDLTGTRIKSDKPVGLISYHQRTNIPTFMNTHRSHLSEMIAPIKSWGKSYASVQFKRKNRGDLFRIVASEDSTHYELRWFDITTDQIIEQRSGNLKKDGDFMDFIEIMSEPGENMSSVRGVANFVSDKPIFVMQYSYSASWDGSNEYNPFMISVPPIQQYSNCIYFQTGQNYYNNSISFLNLIVVGDTLDEPNNYLLMNSIKMDGKPINLLAPLLPKSRIPGTNLYYATINIFEGSHYIESDTKLGGYVYSSDPYLKYGWPACPAPDLDIMVQVDTLAPEIFIDGNEGIYNVRFTELRNGLENDNPKQVDIGISSEPIILPESYNFKYPDSIVSFSYNQPNFDFGFKLCVKDIYKDAKAYISVTDIAGNTILDSISYTQKTLPRISIRLIAPKNDSLKTGRTLKLVWNKAVNADNYLLEVSRNLSFSNLILSSTEDDTSYTLTGLDYDMSYYWRVKPMSSTLPSDWSERWMFTTDALYPPILIQPLNNAVRVSINPTLQWASPQNAPEFNVHLFRYDTSGVNTALQELPNSPAINSWGYNTLTNKNWATLTKYEQGDIQSLSLALTWTVQEAEDVKLMMRCPDRTTITLINGNETIDGVKISDSTTTTFSIPIDGFANKGLKGNWDLWIEDLNGNGGAEISDISMSFNYKTSTLNTIDNSLVTSTVKTFSGLNSNSTYFWQVKAVDGDNRSAWSDVWQFTTELTNSVPEAQSQQRMFAITPQPAANEIIIKFEEPCNELINVRLFDQIGQLSLEKQILMTGNEAHLNTRNLTSGVYQLVVFINGNHYYEKVLIAR